MRRSFFFWFRDLPLHFSEMVNDRQNVVTETKAMILLHFLGTAIGIKKRYLSLIFTIMSRCTLSIVLALGLIAKVNAVILPPTDDTSGTLIFSGRPPAITKRTLTALNGRGTTLPVSRTRTAFLRFAVEEAGISSSTVEQARLTLFFPSVTRQGGLSLHVNTQEWEETFAGPTRSHPSFGEPLLTIPAASVVSKQFVILDVTQQVKDWLANPGTNFGFSVTSPDGIVVATLGSKEGSASGYPPLLEIEGTGATSANIPSSIVKRDAEGNFMVGTITGALVGNSTTAGSAIDFTGQLAGDVVGTQGTTVVSEVGGVSATTVASGVSQATGATPTNTPHSIVRRDGNGNFTAGTITGVFNGNGAGLTEVAASTVGGVLAATVAAATNLANAATTENTPNTIVKRDASGMIPAIAVVTAPPSMVLIPSGSFTMGNGVAVDTDITDAAPVTTTVLAFYIDVNEVTLSQWQAVYYWALDNGYSDLSEGSGKGPNHPVQAVTWYDVVKWCNARSEQAGKVPAYYIDDGHTTIYKSGNLDVNNTRVKWTAGGYRLPTEAEWEKAARGGRIGQRFPWGNTITQNLANYNGNTGLSYDLGPNGLNATGSVGGTNPATTPVGMFAANGYGLNDMAGNVWEWCWDWYGTPYAGGADPKGADSGVNRVLRGGGWNFNAFNARCALRDFVPPSVSNNRFGFRTVIALPE
jgi:formylglycine-generating enzyme